MLGQVGLEALDAAVGLGQGGGVGGRRRLAGPGRQAIERGRFPGPAPLHDVGGVQALPPQQGALVAVAHAGVVLLDDGQLVLGGEGPPAGLEGQRRVVSTHRLIMGALDLQGWHGHRVYRFHLALEGWSATSSVSGQADRKGSRALLAGCGLQKRASFELSAHLVEGVGTRANHLGNAHMSCRKMVSAIGIPSRQRRFLQRSACHAVITLLL